MYSKGRSRLCIIMIWSGICEIIEDIFRNRIKDYYKKEDIEKGYIEVKKKHGDIKKYSLIKICSERVV